MNVFGFNFVYCLILKCGQQFIFISIRLIQNCKTACINREINYDHFWKFFAGGCRSYVRFYQYVTSSRFHDSFSMISTRFSILLTFCNTVYGRLFALSQLRLTAVTAPKFIIWTSMVILLLKVVVVYFILSRLLYLALSADLGLLYMPHPGMGPLV